jgi:hypothetical protein
VSQTNALIPCERAPLIISAALMFGSAIATMMARITVAGSRQLRLAGAFAKERRVAKRELSDELRALRLELAECQTTITELRAAVGGKVIDLPARHVN